MRFVPAVPRIFNVLDDFISTAPEKAHVRTSGIALTRDERAALYRTIGQRSPVGNEFLKASRATAEGLERDRGVKGLRGYYGGFRILAEEEQ